MTTISLVQTNHHLKPFNSNHHPFSNQDETISRIIAETIAVNRTVDPSEFYLLGLPDDVIQAVPLIEMVNSPLGDGPSELPGWLGTLQQIVGFLLQGWIEIVSFFVEVFEAAAEMFLEFVADLADDIAGAVTAAVQIIVDAFAAFLDWAVAFIQEIVDAVFGPIVDAISDLIDDFNYGIAAALSKCTSELASTGEISTYAKSRVSEAFYGDLFWILMGVSALVSIALSAIVGLATVFGFLIGFAVSAITSVLIVNAIGLDAGYVTQAESEIGGHASSVDDSGALAVGDMAIAMALEMDEEHETDPGLFWAVGSVFSWYGFMASMVSFFGFEAGGKIGYTSLAVGLVGAVIAIGSGISPELAIFGVLTGLAGLVFGTIGAFSCLNVGNSGGAVVNIIGGTAGMGGTLASAKSLGWI